MDAYKFIDINESNEIVNKLLSLRDQWYPVRPGLSVLGTPLWLSGLPGTRAHNTNKVLKEHFGDLLEKIHKRLSELLSEPVKAMEGFSLPGFHIFESLEGEDPVGSPAEAHYDSEVWGTLFGYDSHLSKRFAKEEYFDPQATLSFTVALKFPKSGTGLFVWPNLYRSEIIQCMNEYGVSRLASMATLLGRYEREFIPYEIGHLVKHSGQVLHWIAPMVPEGGSVPVGEQRITLQGHGIKIDGVWELFW